MKRENIRVSRSRTMPRETRPPTSTVVRPRRNPLPTGAPHSTRNGDDHKGPGTIKAQTEAVMSRSSWCSKPPRSSLQVLKMHIIYCTSVGPVQRRHRGLRKYLPKDWPARIFISVRPGTRLRHRDRLHRAV